MGRKNSILQHEILKTRMEKSCVVAWRIRLLIKNDSEIHKITNSHKITKTEKKKQGDKLKHPTFPRSLTNWKDLPPQRIKRDQRGEQNCGEADSQYDGDLMLWMDDVLIYNIMKVFKQRTWYRNGCQQPHQV